MNTWSKLMCSLANEITKQKICMIKVLLVQRNGFSSTFFIIQVSVTLIMTFRDVEGTRFFSDYPNRDNSMQHLACFAGGMFAYGAKFEETEEEDLKVTTLTQGTLLGSTVKQTVYSWDSTNFQIGADVTEACYKSYHNTATHIGGERFSIRSNGEVTAGNPAYYILRPEVVESYFYLWRLTKDTKYRDWAWEAAQVSY